MNSRNKVLFEPPESGCVLSLTGLPGGGSKTYDRSPYGNVGTITGATWKRLPSGLWHLSFDGSDDYVDCGNHDSLDITQGITVALWTRADVTPVNYPKILSKANGGSGSTVNKGYIIQWRTGAEAQRITWTIGRGGAWGTAPLLETVSTYDLTLGDWHHIVGTYDNAVAKLYIDGAFNNSRDRTDGLASIASEPLMIGAGHWNDQSTPSGFYNGLIGLVRVYNRPLSALEIQNRFDQERHLF